MSDLEQFQTLEMHHFVYNRNYLTGNKYYEKKFKTMKVKFKRY